MSACPRHRSRFGLARRGLAIAALVSMSVAALHAEEQDGTAVGTTLAPDAAVPVDLRETQREAERVEAERRAQAAAAMPGAAERRPYLPEIQLIEQKVLAGMLVVSVQPDGPTQTWRVRSTAPPELLAQRLIARLLGARFSSVPASPGEEWSGTHGKSRVAVRVEQRVVAVQLVPPQHSSQ